MDLCNAKEIPEIPVDAVREALINSFCHKEYGTGQNNEVSIYKDRVEIYNPGTFPQAMSRRISSLAGSVLSAGTR